MIANVCVQRVCISLVSLIDSGPLSMSSSMADLHLQITKHLKLSLRKDFFCRFPNILLAAAADPVELETITPSIAGNLGSSSKKLNVAWVKLDKDRVNKSKIENLYCLIN